MTAAGLVRLSDVRGYGRLLVDATIGVTEIVENMHHDISRWPRVLGGRSHGRTRGITGLVYGAIRGTTGLAGGVTDAILGALDATGSGGTSTGGRETALAVLNGVVGDHLAATGNPLAIPMSLRRDGRPLDLGAVAREAAGRGTPRRILVFVHGLCMSDLGWRRHGRDRAAELADDIGAHAVYLHYNSGQHVSWNGGAMARQMEALVTGWPAEIDDLTIVGHSMGGLVSRSACHYASEAGHGWLSLLRRMVFVGTPHHGAPLERGGNWLQAVVEATPYARALARLGKLRSAGITDLRHGSLVHEDWRGRDRFAQHGDSRRTVPLPAGVECFAIAGALDDGNGRLRRRMLGDGLVPVRSALGIHDDRRRSLRLPASHCYTAPGTGHLALLHRRRVYDRIRGWLEA